jgi:hypothetical protein
LRASPPPRCAQPREGRSAARLDDEDQAQGGPESGLCHRSARIGGPQNRAVLVSAKLANLTSCRLSAHRYESTPTALFAALVCARRYPCHNIRGLAFECELRQQIESFSANEVWVFFALLDLLSRELFPHWSDPVEGNSSERQNVVCRSRNRDPPAQNVEKHPDAPDIVKLIQYRELLGERARHQTHRPAHL